jgi:hypothetical protein
VALREESLTPLAPDHQAVTFNREPTDEALLPECRDWAKVIKNILSLFAVMLAVVSAVGLVVAPVAGGVAAGVLGVGGCSKPNTLLKESSRRVTPRLGAGGAVLVVVTGLVLAGAAGAGVVGSVAVVVGVVVVGVVPDVGGGALAFAAGVAPSD